MPAGRRSWRSPTGCGLLDTDQPNIVEPERRRDARPAPQARRVGAISDFAFAQDGDGTQFEDGAHPAQRTHVRRVRAPHHAADRAGDRPAAGVRATTARSTTCLHNLHRARAAAEAAAAALRELRAEPDADTGIAEMLSLAGFTYIYFGGELLLRRAVQPAWKATRSSSAQPQTTDEMFETAVARFDAALAHPASQAGGRTGDHLPRRRSGKGRALLDRGLLRRGGRGGGRRAHRVPVRDRARRQPASAAERHLVLQRRLALVGVGSGGWRRPAVSHRGGPAGAVLRRGGASGLDNTTPQFTLLKYPDFSASVVGGRRDRGAPDRGGGAAPGRRISGHDSDPQRPPRPSRASTRWRARVTRTRRSISCSASGPSGCSPPATAWATCAG